MFGDFEQDLEHVLELFSFGRDEEDSSAGSITVEGTVEVHDLVLGSSVGRRVLDLDPLGDEIDQRLRFDRGSWRKLNREGTEFY